MNADRMEHKPEFGQASADELAAQVSEAAIRAVAHDLSLGLDCNVPLMACKEAVAVLFAALQRDLWSLAPPVPEIHATDAEALSKAERRGKSAGYRAALEDMAVTAETTQRSLRGLWAALDRLNADLERIMKARTDAADTGKEDR